MSLHEGEKTRARVWLELSEEFDMKVGVHQGSTFSPLLFAIVVDLITENGLMCEMLHADDLVLTSEMMEGMREMEGSIREQGAKGEPREDKSGSEWGRR